MGVFEKLFGPNVSQLKEKGDFGEILVLLNHDKSRVRIKAFETIGELIEKSPENIYAALRSSEADQIAVFAAAVSDPMSIFKTTMRKMSNEELKKLDKASDPTSVFNTMIREGNFFFQRIVYLVLIAHTLFDKDASIRHKSTQMLVKLYNTSAINDLITIFVKGCDGMSELELPWKDKMSMGYGLDHKYVIYPHTSSGWCKMYYTESKVQFNALDALVKEGVKISHIENEKKKIEENFIDPIVKHNSSEILRYYPDIPWDVKYLLKLD